jgi:hypothetical protein
MDGRSPSASNRNGDRCFLGDDKATDTDADRPSEPLFFFGALWLAFG